MGATNSSDLRDLENETAAPSADVQASEKCLPELCVFSVPGVLDLFFFFFFKMCLAIVEECK